MNNQPPRFAKKLLRLFTRQVKDDSFIGDCEEMHQILSEERGRMAAALWYWGQILKSIPALLQNRMAWSLIMFRNYSKVTFRNIRRHKGYSFINLAGLAIGMASCLLIILYIYSELSYDRYHQHANQIYRIGTHFDLGQMNSMLAVSNHPIGKLLSRDYPEVREAVKIRPKYRNLVEYQDQQFYETGIYYSENSIFDVFSFPLVAGDVSMALSSPNTIVITEEMAVKYFGSDDPLGKVLRFNDEEDFTVTGVLTDIPPNSHFTFRMLCSFETWNQQNPVQKDEWMGDFNNYTYILLEKNASVVALTEKLPPLVEKHIGELMKTVGGEIRLFLQPLTRIHLHSRLQGEISGNGDVAYVYIFTAIALFILIIACINFMNLSTARSSERAKEVGLRKVLGSGRSQLVKQFLSESILFSLSAFILSIVLVQLALPHFRTLSGSSMHFHLLEVPWLLPAFLGLTLFVGLMAGSYPSFYLSAFHPLRVLKGTLIRGTSHSRFRSTLVVIQFSISVALIVGTTVILRQITFMKNRELGFDKSHVVVLPLPDNGNQAMLEAMKEEFKRDPRITRVAVSSHVPGEGKRHNGFLPQGFEIDQSQMIGSISIDHDFLSTLNIEIVEGRNFSPEFTTDAESACLINETAVETFGWDEPIGKTMRELDGRGVEKTVVGVVRDFHWESLHQTIEPLHIEYRPGYFNFISVRIKPGEVEDTIDYLQKKWQQHDPNGTFDYRFLDRLFDSQYRTEERLSTLFSYFTFLAILVACLGLFGLASFTAEQRTKEIGVRKVLGSSIGQIVYILSKETVRWVLLANVIAWPIAWFAMNRWLQGFAYRINIHLDIFILSGAIALAIALLTVCYKSIWAAKANPIDALRYE